MTHDLKSITVGSKLSLHSLTTPNDAIPFIYWNKIYDIYMSTFMRFYDIYVDGIPFSYQKKKQFQKKKIFADIFMIYDIYVLYVDIYAFLWYMSHTSSSCINPTPTYLILPFIKRLKLILVFSGAFSGYDINMKNT